MHNRIIDGSSRLKPGMELILTRQIALLGTALLAKQQEPHLLRRFPEAMVEEAKGFDVFADTTKEQNLIQDLTEAEIFPLGEGGILAGLWKIADRAGVGMTADLRKMTIRQETVEICEELDVNPYLLESSGALLVGAAHGYALAEELNQKGIPAVVIGRTDRGNDRIIYNQDRRRFVDKPAKDELCRFFPNWKEQTQAE